MILRLQQGGQCHKNTCSKSALLQRKSLGNDRSNKLKLGENLLHMFLYLLLILLDDDSPSRRVSMDLVFLNVKQQIKLNYIDHIDFCCIEN